MAYRFTSTPHALATSPFKSTTRRLLTKSPSHHQHRSCSSSSNTKMPTPAFEPTPSLTEKNPNLGPALSSLLERNAKFSSSIASERPDLLEAIGKGQAPKVFWIGCADSRMPEGTICQTDPGEIFTVRNIANQWSEEDDSANAALLFAVEALGVEEVVVVGHTSCGGVSAAIDAALSSATNTSGSAPSTSLTRYLIPLANLASDLIKNGTIAKDAPKAEFARKLTTANVLKQVENLRKSEVIQRNWKTGESTLVQGRKCNKVRLHGWVKDVATTKIHDLNVSEVPPSN